MYGVSFDTPEENREFSEKYGFFFPLLSDEKRELAMAFGAAQSASDQNADRVGVILDSEGNLIRHYPKASARTFPVDVLKELNIEVDMVRLLLSAIMGR